MSKLGRYSAQRRKVEAVSADKTVELHDCGTIFVGTGTLTVTLPDATVAGEGWWCRVVKATNASVLTVNVSTNMADDAASNAGVGGGAGGSDGMETIVGNFILAADGSAGSMAEVYSDGTQWYTLAFSDSGNGITVQ